MSTVELRNAIRTELHCGHERLGTRLSRGCAHFLYLHHLIGPPTIHLHKLKFKVINIMNIIEFKMTILPDLNRINEKKTGHLLGNKLRYTCLTRDKKTSRIR